MKDLLDFVVEVIGYQLKLLFSLTEKNNATLFISYNGDVEKATQYINKIYGFMSLVPLSSTALFYAMKIYKPSSQIKYVGLSFADEAPNRVKNLKAIGINYLTKSINKHERSIDIR